MEFLLQNLNKLDKFLGQYAIINDLEKKTHIPKAYLAVSTVIFYLLLVAFNIWGALLVNIVGFLYPAYASFKAIESPGTADDTQWLTYWTVFGFMSVIEFFSDLILYWVPFYYVIKTAIIVYLYLPQFRGAEALYVKAIRPYFKQTTQVDAAIEKMKKKVNDAVSDKFE